MIRTLFKDYLGFRNFGGGIVVGFSSLSGDAGRLVPLLDFFFCSRNDDDVDDVDDVDGANDIFIFCSLNNNLSLGFVLLGGF